MKAHKYELHNFEILKLASIYGANASGKSNLVKSLSLLQDIVEEESIPTGFSNKKFKFHADLENTIQTFAIEFFQKGKYFYYGIEIKDNHIHTEELYESGLGKKDDQLIFERKTNDEKKTVIKFFDDFESNAEGIVLKRVIEKNLSKPNKPILKLLTTLDSPFLKDVATAFNWFDETLRIITPTAKPAALAQKFDTDENFQKYAQEIMCSFSVGVESLKLIRNDISDFLGEENKGVKDDILARLEESPEQIISLRNRMNGNETIIVQEDEHIVSKQLQLEHTGGDGKKIDFDLEEESDGTIRLLDFIPALKGITNESKVFVIDEIERSIHPLLIKELVKKFADDDRSNGQLIFTTHESNLLDQNIFRQDEIWFIEKDRNGCSDLYSLSDYKPHSTIDIQKGYLSGRYGSIPFLANLQDLNWNKYDTKE